MKTSRKPSRLPGAFVFVLLLVAGLGVTAEAAGGNVMNEMVGGVAAVLHPANGSAEDVINATAEELNIDLSAIKLETHSNLVMADVKTALNVRMEPSEDGKKVGKLYKDCGGTILEYGDGWTKLQSGNVVGWCINDYLLFDEEAEALAKNVGMTLARVSTASLRVRKAPDLEAGVWGMAPEGEVLEVIGSTDGDWICVDYEGEDGYVSAEYVDISFQIDAGETLEEIKAREEAEREAKRHVNYGAFMTDADTTLLLAALVQCEAGNQPYEGMVAVAAVVMNRVRSSAYPDSIHGVIYASGQFTPALNGKVNNLYNSGRIKDACKKAAEEAISGVSNVGACTHFRRNDGRDGIVIGNHVFY